MTDGLLLALALAQLVVLVAVLLLVLQFRRRIRELSDNVRDEQRRLQSELDRREEYVATVARELMNPIASISYAARALHEGAMLDLARVASGIAAEAASAADLVRALTDAVRVEARHLHLALAPVDLIGVARTTLDSFIPGPRHRVVLDTPCSELAVEGDAAALAKVVRHLLSNAVTYAPPGTVRVEVDRGPDGRTATLAVRDAGPGIPESERALLFRKFARLSTAGGTVGAGLGLYVSRAIVEEHGGVLSADWPSDGGSRFWFSVPLATGSAPVPA